MKKSHKIILFIFVFILLTTYHPIKLNLLSKEENSYFTVKNIKILNLDIISEYEIDRRLSHLYGKNIFFLERENIFNPLESIEFLEKIEVKKKYPDTIIIKIYETKPIAIIIKNNKKYFIDNSSNLIDFREGLFKKNFPSIFGDKAEIYFIDFFNKLDKNNFPTKKIKNYYFFQIGRWDLQLTNEKTIKLPSTDIENAIKKSIKLLKREDFKTYNILDLRIHGKIVVE